MVVFECVFILMNPTPKYMNTSESEQGSWIHLYSSMHEEAGDRLANIVSTDNLPAGCRLSVVSVARSFQTLASFYCILDSRVQ